MSTPNQTVDSSELETKLQEVYASFLTNLLAKCSKDDFYKKALGRHLLEMLQKQAQTLSSPEQAAAGIDVKSDLEALLAELVHNVKWLDERGMALKKKLNEDAQRVEEAIRSGRHLGWLTDAGKGMFQRTLDMSFFLLREASVIPLRTRATIATLLSAHDVVKGSPTERELKMALEAAWCTYYNYYLDSSYLRSHAPGFEQKAQAVHSALATIDERIATREAEKSRQEALEQEEYRRAREEEERLSSANANVRHTGPVDDPEPFEWHSYEEPSYTQHWVNPANGLPMMGNSMVDVHGNAYGTDFF